MTFRNALFMLSAGMFAAVTLISLIAYGGPGTRKIAILAAFLACLSQFVAQDDQRAYRIASVIIAYIAFALVLVAIWAL